VPVPKSARDNGVSPYWQTTDGHTVRLYHGHSLRVLSGLPPGSAHMAVTSPPYWGLRDYRTGSTDELGGENTPEEYVARLVAIFRELRRVLRDDGTLWLNLGDSYLPDGNLAGVPWRVALAMQTDNWILRQEVIWAKTDCMPESVDNRCTRAHEQLFLFAKGRDYFYDSYAIREKQSGSLKVRKVGERLPGDHHGQSEREVADSGYRNKRDVWTVSHGAGYAGNHFAAYPPLLIEPCILAGTSAHGCCPECGAPWRRILEKVRVPTRPGEDSKVWSQAKAPGRQNAVHSGRGPGGQTRSYRERLTGEVTGNRDPERHVTEVRVLGWYPTCGCDGLSELKPAPPVSKGWNAVTPKAKANAPPDARGNAGARSQGRDGDADWSPEYQSQYAEWVAGVRQECVKAAQVRPPEELVPAVVLDPFIGSGTTALVALEHGRAALGIELSKDHLDHDCTERVKRSLLDRPFTRSLVPREGRGRSSQ
jgi:DNA modification methylase